MNILFSLPIYVPYFNCGAEVMAHNIATELVKRKHKVRVVVHRSNEVRGKYPYKHDKIEVFNSGYHELLEWADVVITHLEACSFTVKDCRKIGKPVVYIAHNDIKYNELKRDVKIIFNSQWIKDVFQHEGKSIVFPPPVTDWYKVKQDKPEYVTLINLSENKGYKLFYSIAKRLPQYKFMGVVGSYGNQIALDYPNVTIVPNTSDIRSVYEKTKILLMPSGYESWGKTATEAAKNGIPTISTATPGLKENLGDAGIYLTRKQLEDWVQWIKRLMEDEKFYKVYSEKVKARAKELEPKWDELEKFLLS